MIISIIFTIGYTLLILDVVTKICTKVMKGVKSKIWQRARKKSRS